MKTRLHIFLLFSIVLFFSSCSNSADNEVLIGELTNGSFDAGPKFNSDFTFTWEVNNDLKISGNYRIGKIYKNENKAGYVGLRRLGWVITFSNVSNSDYWDKDNSMNLHYTWNHSKADKMFELKGSSIYYPMSFYKDVDGTKLIQKYWDNVKELDKPNTSKSVSNDESIAADNITIVEEVNSIETDSVFEDSNDSVKIFEKVVRVDSWGAYSGEYYIDCIFEEEKKIKLYVRTDEIPSEFSPISLNTDNIEGTLFKVTYIKRKWLLDWSNGELVYGNFLMSCEPYSLD